MLRAIQILLICNFAICLSACSQGPSDNEVESAMKARISEMDPGSESAPRVDSAKNIRCVSTGSGSTYTCDVEVEMTVPMVGHMKSVAQLKMIKSGDLWSYDKHQIVSMRPSNSP